MDECRGFYVSLDVTDCDFKSFAVAIRDRKVFHSYLVSKTSDVMTEDCDGGCQTPAISQILFMQMLKEPV